jgi:hypothetical protein
MDFDPFWEDHRDGSARSATSANIEYLSQHDKLNLYLLFHVINHIHFKDIIVTFFVSESVELVA